MSDRRKTQKNHIRAARDWLGQAEHSLDHENDVRGDLKLMLAKAELSQVQASPHGRWLKGWGIRVVPAVIALVIAAGGWLVWSDTTRQDPAVVTGSETALAGSRPVVDHQQSEQPVTQSPSDERVQAPAEISKSAQEPSVAVKAQPAAAPEIAQPHVSQPARPAVGAVPTPETQKLMQSAGKALRQ